MSQSLPREGVSRKAHRLNMVPFLFLHIPWAKNNFHHLCHIKVIKFQFHVHKYSFLQTHLCIVDGYFHNTMAKVSAYNRNLTCKVENYYLLFDPLQKKFLTANLESKNIPRRTFLMFMPFWSIYRLWSSILIINFILFYSPILS